MIDKKAGEVVSFSEASNPHVHARKEAKLKKVHGAFKAASKDKFKDARNQRRDDQPIGSPVTHVVCSQVATSDRRGQGPGARIPEKTWNSKS